MQKIICLGEPMLEFSNDAAGRYCLGVAGDVYNTAAAVANLGARAALLTGLGDDAHSAAIRQAIAAQGVGVEAIRTISGKLPGLYLIDNDSAGERYFSYWRSDSAARYLFADTEALGAAIAEIDPKCWLYLSAITLALMSQASRSQFTAWLDEFRTSGGSVVYDNNYRPALWPDREVYRVANERMLAHVDIYLPSLDDARSLDPDAADATLVAAIARSNVPEVVIKAGDGDVVLLERGARRDLPLVERREPVDTTGAGDGFNGGYLAARLRGLAPAEAVAAGMAVAAEVVSHSGAILDDAQWPALRKHLFSENTVGRS